MSFATAVHREILAETKKVATRKYVQFHYSPLGERLLLGEFKRCERKLVLLNVPPAFVYSVDLKRK